MSSPCLKAVGKSGFVHWFSSQLFWQLKRSDSSRRLSFQLGRAPILIGYGLVSIAIGIFGFYVAFSIQPMFLSTVQNDFSAGAYMEIIKTYLLVSLFFLIPCLLTSLGVWLLGFKGVLLIDADERLISKQYSFFKFILRSKSWDIHDLHGMSVCSYGKGIITARIHQLRMVQESQPPKAIITCGRAFLANLNQLAEQAASFLNIPLSSN